MREIKFRGKRVGGGQWVYGYYAHMGVVKKNGTMEFAHMLLDTSSKDAEGLKQYRIDHETVGQFTGLKDKNGKEIYEGDIYHQGDKNIRFKVVWHDTGLIGKQIKASSYAGLSYWLDRIEIIGNIYENPELLN